jgi:hypothetical protein
MSDRWQGGRRDQIRRQSPVRYVVIVTVTVLERPPAVVKVTVPL